MKIYHLTLLLVVLTNGLLSVSGARLKCPSVYIANGSYKIRSKGRIIVYKCSRGFYLLGEPYAACIRGKWDSNPPVCLKPGCPRPTNLLNGEVHDSWRSSLLKFTCNPGYKLTGPSYIYCNGRYWSAAQPHCQAVDIKCDFEKKTPCNWIIDDNDGGDFNWRLQQHEPPSRVLKTGPLHDHTLSPNTTGHYLVLETSDYISSLKPARIHSPVFPQPSDNSSCFIFWYHMYGSTIGTLNVFLNNLLAFQRQGNHGDHWIKGIISLSENVTSSDLKIIIEGSYGGGYTGDIGLDDFSIGNGTDCLTSTVKSCVGRCYEEKNDASSCLCNPECSVDSSCCEDFLDVCSLESTTPFFEASTEVEDSTQVYSDTSGTTDYDNSFSETPINLTESDFTATLENSTSSSSFTPSLATNSMYSKTDKQFEKTDLLNTNDNILSSSVNPNIDEDNIKSQSTINNVSDIKILYFSTTPSVQKEQESNKSTEESIILNRFSSLSSVIYLKNIQVTEKTTLLHLKNNITTKSCYDTTTVANSTHYNHLFKTNSHQTSTKFEMNKLTNFTNKGTTSIIPKAVSIKIHSFNVSTDETFIPNNKTESREGTTYVPLKIDTLRTKEPDLNKNFTSLKKKLFTRSTTSFHLTNIFHTTPVPNLTFSMTSKSVAKSLSSSVDEAHLSTVATTDNIMPVQSTTNATLTNLKSITHSLVNNKVYFNITTVLPLFYNVTVSTSDQTKITTSKINSQKIGNNSHTHLQTTSRLPPLFNTTEESFTSIIKSTLAIKHNTVDSSKKWKSIYKPKDSFVFSAAQRSRDSVNKTYVILSACAAVIGVISILLIVLFIRRRRLMFVNELEEADTDILYHSSQEMLDLHIARPNH